jgi:hypothetical protein
MPRVRLILACGILLILPVLPCAARSSTTAALQEEPGETPLEKPAPPAADEKVSPPSTAPESRPEDLADFTVRSYRIKPQKLWKALLPALEAAGHPPEEIDQGTMTARTSFVDFEQKNFGEQVTDPPRPFGPGHPVITMKRVAVGKVSLEAIVSKTRGGAVLKIRARILVQGLDRRQRIMVMIDRRSSGVIEAEFLRKLEDDLVLKRI